MACPRCGGTQRTTIAPGYFECTSVITRQIPTQTPVGVVPLPQALLCGQRYHEGGAGAASGGVCRCGTFSVGICTSCGSHVCGDHSVAGSQRICDLCVAKRRDDIDREITDAYQRDLNTLKNIADPQERLVRALAYLLPEEPYLTSSDPLNMMYRHLVPLTRPGQY